MEKKEQKELHSACDPFKPVHSSFSVDGKGMMSLCLPSNNRAGILRLAILSYAMEIINRLFHNGDFAAGASKITSLQ